MEKRKSRLNILDIAIFAVIICALVALAFRDTINDAFGKPENVVLKLEIVSPTADDGVKALFNQSIIDIDINHPTRAVVTETDLREDNIFAVIECNGYKKFGRYYTETGDLLETGKDISLQYGEITVYCRLQSVSPSSPSEKSE